MNARHSVTYLFDTLCGWCYGASPAISRLASTPGIDLKLAPVGLFSGPGARPIDEAFAAYAWANDQRIGQLTGQQFSERYRSEILSNRDGRLDSGPATIALTAVSWTYPERELDALKAIQEARYVEGKDVTSFPVLAEILDILNLTDASAAILRIDNDLIDANEKRIGEARLLMRRLRATGVPTLAVGTGSHAHLLDSNLLFGSHDDLLALVVAA